MNHQSPPVFSSAQRALLVVAGIAAAVIPAAMATFPAPENGPIVFVDCNSGVGEIYRINADGRGRKRLVSDFVIADAPRVSPDGNRVVFTTDIPSNTMYVVSIDGGTPVPVPGTELLTFVDDPTWTPDGESLVFQCDLGLCKIDVAGGTPFHIPGTTVDDFVPDVHPNGGEVAFVKDTAGQLDVYTIPLIGGVPTQRTTCPAPPNGCSVPTYSPDGLKLALQLFTPADCAAVIDLTASPPVPPSCLGNSASGVDSRPAFSPDGLQIVVDAGDGHLAILDATGTPGARQQFHTGVSLSCSPAWARFVDKKAPEAFCGQFFFDAQRKAEAKQGQLSVKFIKKGCDATALTTLQPDLVKFDAAIDKIALKANENILKKGGPAECDSDLVAEFADGVDPDLIERIDLLDGAATGADFLMSEVADFCDS